MKKNFVGHDPKPDSCTCTQKQVPSVSKRQSFQTSRNGCEASSFHLFWKRARGRILFKFSFPTTPSSRTAFRSTLSYNVLGFSGNRRQNFLFSPSLLRQGRKTASNPGKEEKEKVIIRLHDQEGGEEQEEKMGNEEKSLHARDRERNRRFYRQT